MPTIEQDLMQIRGAVYGRDVREAIADGIEKAYATSSSANEKADGVSDPITKGLSVSWRTGYLINSSGVELTTVSNYVDSDYIVVDENSRIYIHDMASGTGVNGYSFYNASKQFISGAQVAGNLEITTIPSGARYARFCSSYSAWDPHVYVQNHSAVRDKIETIGNSAVIAAGIPLNKAGLPDANEATPNRIYTIAWQQGSSDYVANLPYPQAYGTLITLGPNLTGEVGQTQIFIEVNSGNSGTRFFTRIKWLSGSSYVWKDWRKLYSDADIYVSGTTLVIA